MLNIRTIHFADEAEKLHLEKAMRKYASKRSSPLDFLSAQTDFKTEKKFLGYEGKGTLQFTRLRSSFEKFLPKLIVQIPKTNEKNYYQIRLSWSSTIPIGFMVFLFVILVWGMVIGAKDFRPMLGISIFCIGYPLWTFAELHFTESKIEEALKATIDVTVAV